MIKIPKIELLFPFKREINSFIVKSGEVFKVMGESGRGKTTYLNELVKYFINTKAENILFLKQSHKPPPFIKIQDIFIDYDILKVKSILKKLDIKKSLKSNCSELSGGEIQRVLLAEAILYNPVLMILDEPVSAVDKNGVEIISNVLMSYSNQGGMIIYVSHVKLTDQYNPIDI